jgi:protocatechuate 3,4-dioxygenase beta subunit
MNGADVNASRRRLLIAAMGAAAGAVSPTLAALTVTPHQTRGPFYPVEIPLDHDTDLTRVGGQARIAEGKVVDVVGRILDAKGRPLSGARVEIWQCDARGRYRHPRDRGHYDPDPAFQGYGVTTADAEGAYRFRTIHPVAYPGRAPHIHFAIRDPRGHTLVTQMYVAGEPRNPRDFLYSRLSAADREAVTVAFSADAAHAGAEQIGRFDIVLDLSQGTPGLG